MPREHYLDNSATTRVCEKSAEKVLELMTQCYGNPSSLHKKGLEAQREVAHARQAVAVSLGAQPREIIFTSGGTEANNLAVLGGAAAVEAIACVMAIRDGVVPPTIGYQEADPDCDLDITPNRAVEMPVNVAISNSLGFGGHNACILIKKV